MTRRARTWRAPAALAVISAGGLLGGLLGDGAWDGLAATALVLPLLVAWLMGRRAKCPAGGPGRGS